MLPSTIMAADWVANALLLLLFKQDDSHYKLKKYNSYAVSKILQKRSGGKSVFCWYFVFFALL